MSHSEESETTSNDESEELEDSEESEQENVINILENQFQTDNNLNRIKRGFKKQRFHKNWKLPDTRNYYSRPTPPDIQYEERSKFQTSKYDGKSLYEWNIDGKAEYEILNTLQEMGMARLAYKIRNADEKTIATLLVSGFTGQLKNWWDNALTLESKTSILEHTIDIEDDQGDVITKSDAAEFLIVTIVMYFVGNPKEELNSTKVFLTNLRCPTLTDFRWYKDMFITNVLRRPDCNASFWKEKFITGLPALFSQRIMTSLQ